MDGPSFTEAPLSGYSSDIVYKRGGGCTHPPKIFFFRILLWGEGAGHCLGPQGGGGGGLFGALVSLGRPPHPPTHIRKSFPRQKNEIY